MTPRPVHLVVDAGVDDALAVMAACLHPGLELAAVTAAAGNVSLARSAANVRHVLDVLTVRVGVSRGATVRADGRPFEHRDVHGPDGLAGVGSSGALSPNALASLPVLDDRQRWDSARAQGRPAPPMVMCLAPLTSLLQLDPLLEQGQVVATYARPGEANHAMDPMAADVVRRTWPVTDAAVHSLPLTPLGHERRTPTVDLASRLLEHQRRRGAGLGDAEAVLRLAGETDPVQAFRRLLANVPAHESP